MATMAPMMIWARRVPLSSRQRSAIGRSSKRLVRVLIRSPGRDRAAGRALRDVADRPALLGGLQVSALLAVVRRHRARAPAHFPEVIWDRVLVRAPAPQAGGAELRRIGEHPLLEGLGREVGAGHL